MSSTASIRQPRLVPDAPAGTAVRRSPRRLTARASSWRRATVACRAEQQQEQHQQQQEQVKHQQHTAPAAAAPDPLPALRAWVAAAGGHVDARLTVTECAPLSGCRGVVAASPISLDDLEAGGPIISVPQALQFSSTTALGIIVAAAGAAAAEAAAEQLSSTQLIAAALAHELLVQQQHGSSSWGPYLASLPQQPPNPWLLECPKQQVTAAVAAVLAAAGSPQGGSSSSSVDAAAWVAAVARERQRQLESAAAAQQLLGAALGISRQQVLLALGHVASRSLAGGSSGGGGNSGGLCPVIDLINHHSSAAAPMLQLDDADRLVMTVLPIREGEAAAMAAGGELVIAYKGGYSPLEAFLKFGFVAPDWWAEE